MGFVYIFYGEETARRYGLPCWMQSMTLHQPTTRGQPGIPKMLQHSSELFRKVIGNAVEVHIRAAVGHRTTHVTHYSS